jgi:hypothetical protein
MRQIPSFLHLALNCLEKEGGKPKTKKKGKRTLSKNSMKGGEKV